MAAPSGNDSVVCYSNSSAPVLLQTAQAVVFNPQEPNCKVKVRIILHNGSQRTYLTDNLKNTLRLPSQRKKQVSIKTFGSTDERLEQVDVVAFGIELNGEPDLLLSAFTVPLICQPLQSQPVNRVIGDSKCFSGLRLADYSTGEQNLDVNILIGSDYYWTLVTGHTIRGSQDPTAVHTKLGWVLSGPGSGDAGDLQRNNLVTTHVLKCANEPVSYEGLEGELKKFWDLKSLSIQPPSVYEEFLEKLTYNGDHCEVHLPWKATHPPLPDNYELSERRSRSLLNRLRKEPDVMKEYDGVIREQIERRIVEVVGDQTRLKTRHPVHYIPHHVVIRKDKSTTRLRIVYDASAKSDGASFNECLHAGPALTKGIFDIMLRFRSHKVAIVGDIEKAFLMVHMAEADKDVLRFLWVDDISKPEPQVITLRFTRVVCGLSSSPFLLNATIKHHMEQYEQCDPDFTKKFLERIYVDDLTSGDSDVDRTWEFYVKSKLRLKDGGFNLRRFITNSEELRARIRNNETLLSREEETQSANAAGNEQCPQPRVTRVNASETIEEEDMTYSRSVLGAGTVEHAGKQRILGTLWNFHDDYLVFDLTNTTSLAKGADSTTRSVISIASKFYDPLGVLSPITVQFKVLFQELCKDKIDWDDPLEGHCKTTWQRLVTQLEEVRPIKLPRCYYTGIEGQVVSSELHGFCDASAKAYGAVVYLRIITTCGNYVRFVASKIRVAPLSNQTIPRLELLSAVLLARLMNSVREALTSEVEISKSVCWTDSKLAWYWIVQSDRDWKQFVQHRVDEIRRLVPVECWNHCPAVDNPADILSRGIDPRSLEANALWWNGPAWLTSSGRPEIQSEFSEELLPEECLTEMEAKDLKAVLTEDTALTVNAESVSLSKIIHCGEFSSLERLLRVTALVLKFVRILKAKRSGSKRAKSELTSVDLEEAKLYWIKEVQASLKTQEKFRSWQQQWSLFEDDKGVVRCQGRLKNSDLMDSAKYPILLDTNHHFTALVVWSCHNRVMHRGVKETQAELRSNFWIVCGRYFLRKLLFKCTVCRRVEGKPYKLPSPPPLPRCRMEEAPAFTYIGLDYVGPLYVKSAKEEDRKMWICLFTRCVTRAVHF